MPERKRIVAVIDGDANMRKGIERLLAAHGFATEGYVSAEDFLTGQDRGAAECMVLDIGLEGMSGIELRRRMIGSNCDIPTIFITGANNPATIRDACALVCVACLMKPFTASPLIGAVKRAIVS
jgi:FixJ family two-component response regulator